MPVNAQPAPHYASGRYWKSRETLLYYRYVEQIMATIGRPGASVVDIGSGNAPYMDWFDWAGERLSVDIRVPYRSEKVQGLQADILEHDFGRRFDYCLCLQVLEHLDAPAPFARRLFELGDTVVISVPFGWPKGRVKWHPQDPVDRAKLRGWTGLDPDYEIVVTEPLKTMCHERLIAVYDPRRLNAPVQEHRAKIARRGG